MFNAAAAATTVAHAPLRAHLCASGEWLSVNGIEFLLRSTDVVVVVVVAAVVGGLNDSLAL